MLSDTSAIVEKLKDRMLSAYERYSTVVPFNKSSRGAVAWNTIPQIPRGVAVHVLTTSSTSNYAYYPSSRDSERPRHPDFFSNRNAKEYLPAPPQPPPAPRSSVLQLPPDHTIPRSSSDRRIGGYKIMPKSSIPDTFIYEASVDTRSEISSSSSSSNDDTLSVDYDMRSTGQRAVNDAAVLRATNPAGEIRSSVSSGPANPPSSSIPPPSVPENRIPSPPSVRLGQGRNESNLSHVTPAVHNATVETVSDSDTDTLMDVDEAADFSIPTYGGRNPSAPPGLLARHRSSVLIGDMSAHYSEPIVDSSEHAPFSERTTQVSDSQTRRYSRTPSPEASATPNPYAGTGAMSQSFLEGENVSMNTARARSSSSRTPSPEVMQSMPNSAIDSSARPLLQHDGYDIVPELPRQRSSSRTPSPEGNSGPSDAGNRRSVAFFDESITVVQAGQRFDASSRTPSPEVIAAASRVRRQSIVNISPPTLEATINCRTVRWSENLICPSPMLPSRRRKGWYNKRGDQLWTNDGHFAPAEPGTEYPPDLDEYPDFGVGWMKEDGTRIDMEHRLIPKVPLRSALKKTCAREVLQTARPRSEVRFVGP